MTFPRARCTTVRKVTWWFWFLGFSDRFIHLFVVWPLVGLFHFARQNRVRSARVSDLGPNGGRRQHGSHAGEWEALCLDPDWEPALGRLELIITVAASVCCNSHYLAGFGFLLL